VRRHSLCFCGLVSSVLLAGVALANVFRAMTGWCLDADGSPQSIVRLTQSPRLFFMALSAVLRPPARCIVAVLSRYIRIRARVDLALSPTIIRPLSRHANRKSWKLLEKHSVFPQYQEQQHMVRACRVCFRVSVCAAIRSAFAAMPAARFLRRPIGFPRACCWLTVVCSSCPVCPALRSLARCVWRTRTRPTDQSSWYEQAADQMD
jgi:hypothetical protein